MGRTCKLTTSVDDVAMTRAVASNGVASADGSGRGGWCHGSCVVEEGLRSMSVWL